MGEAEPEALKDASELRVALALAEPDSDACALAVGLALAVALHEVEGVDEALSVGV